jgi:hypothetical protein
MKSALEFHPSQSLIDAVLTQTGLLKLLLSPVSSSHQNTNHGDSDDDEVIIVGSRKINREETYKRLEQHIDFLSDRLEECVKLVTKLNPLFFYQTFIPSS